MNPTSDYLETQVLTATPQKLRLMLIEGAIRGAQLLLAQWNRGEDDFALESYQKARDILVDLGASVDRDGSELTRRVIALYVFLSQTLIDGYYEHDIKKVSEVLRLLELERATWQQLCEQMPEAPQMSVHPGQQEISLGNQRAIPPMFVPEFTGGDGSLLDRLGRTSEGFSLDA